MTKHVLLNIGQRQNKDKTKSYNLAFVGIINDNSVDVVNIMISEEQVRQLKPKCLDQNFDIGKYIVTEYNSYQKQYIPKITYGQN